MYDSQKHSFAQQVDVRGGLSPKRQIIWSVIHFLPRDETRRTRLEEQSASFLKVPAMEVMCLSHTRS